MKEYICKNQRKILTFSLVALPIVLFYLTLGCPLRFFTGICCPGCGMSRALLALVQFDFTTAFHMHPLIFIMPIVALIYISRNKIPPKIRIALAVVFFLLMAVTYVIRLLNGSDVVYIDTSRGFISEIIEFISGGI